MPYSIRNYEEKDKDNVIEVIQSVWGESTVERFKRFYSWYRQHPLALNSDLIVEREGKVVGYTRFIPARYKVGNRQIDAYYISDNVTLKRDRGSGIKLLRYILSLKDKLLIGIPLDRAALLWRKLAKKPVKVQSIEKCVLVLKPSKFLKGKMIPSIFLRLVDTIWELKINVMLRLLGVSKGGSLQINKDPVLPDRESLNELFEKFSGDFYVIANRSHDSLRWRFIDSPLDYKYLWLWKGEQLLGYAVYRNAEVYNRKIVLIIEMVAVGDKKINYGAMINRIISHGMENDCADVQTLFSGCPEYWQTLRHLGAIRRVQKEGLQAFSTPYFNDIYSNEKWFLSLAESDYEFVIFPE